MPLNSPDLSAGLTLTELFKASFILVDGIAHSLVDIPAILQPDQYQRYISHEGSTLFCEHVFFCAEHSFAGPSDYYYHCEGL